MPKGLKGFQKGHSPTKGCFKKGDKRLIGHHPGTEFKKGNKIGIKTRFQDQGKDSNPYPNNWTDDLKESIRKRDDYICQVCGIHQDELNYILDIHHKDYNKDNLNPNNLISLCRSCHMKTNYDRKYWTNYFKIKQDVAIGVDKCSAL